AGQQKVGAGFCPQKGVWQPLAASQMLCLPHPRVGKIASAPGQYFQEMMPYAQQGMQRGLSYSFFFLVSRGEGR
ncbi:hypothetical protein, partial [Intestinimonas butyriciproducens]|uniref:hypothetical protein n=1 Tax=Intestinimonas butyriciproducens TaxID=1297617 RepID=UPI00195DF24D